MLHKITWNPYSKNTPPSQYIGYTRPQMRKYYHRMAWYQTEESAR